MDKKSVILPHTTPPITSWTWHANLLSIIFPYPETHDWIFSNYLHAYLHAHDRFGKRQFLDFWPSFRITFRCPFIKTQVLSRKTICSLISNENIISFFKNMIDDGNFIYGVFNEHFVNRKFLAHELCLYGYDDETERFLVKDFTLGKSGRFSETMATFSDIEKAYLTINENDDYLLDWKGGLLFFSYCSNGSYGLSRDILKKDIYEYLSGINISKYEHAAFNWFEDVTFGLKIYDEIINNLEDSEFGNDVRVFSNFTDHKTMLNLRTRHLYAKGILSDANLLDVFSQIEKSGQQLLNMSIKQSVRKDNKIDGMVSQLRKIKAQEFDALNKLFNLL